MNLLQAAPIKGNAYPITPIMNQLQLHFLGDVQITVEKRPLSLGQKTVELLAFLALATRPCSRSHLVQTLWPDTDPTRARRQLSDILYRLRQQLGSHCILVEKEMLSLLHAPHISVDMWTFQQLSQSAIATDWQTAVSLYTGDFLPQFDQEWVLQKRVLLQETYFATLLRLAKDAEQKDDPQTALHCYQTLQQADPLQEQATRGLMRALAKLGRLDEAVRVYQKLAQILDDSLQIAPAQGTQQLAAQLQQELELQTAVKQRPAQHPFVGRVAERRHLLTQLDHAANGKGGITTIFGEGGMGKTRLLQTVADAAAWRGWHISWGHGEQFGLPAPFAPFAQAFAAALPAPRQQQLSHLIRPSTLDLIQQTLLSPNPQPPTSNPQSPTPNLQTLQQAIYQTLHSLQQITPHLLILDDVQWADHAIWALLDYLQPTLHEQRIFILLAGRADGLRVQKEAWQRLQSWDRLGESIIHLQGLDDTALQELASHQNKPLSVDALHQLQQSSGGNPLLALNLLRSGRMHNPPKTLTDFATQRMTTLSDPAQLALQAAAILGYEIAYPLWEKVLDQIEAVDFPHLAGELEQAHLIQLGDNSYHFAHDTLRAAVYNNIPAQRRQRLHQNALVALQEAGHTNALNLTYHAEQAEDKTAVAQYALIAAQDALKRYSYETAVLLFSKAIATLPDDALDAQYAARYGRIQANDILANRNAQEADLAALQTIVLKLDDPHKHAELFAQNGRFALTIGQLDSAFQETEKALTHVQKSNDRPQQAHLHHQMGQILREQGELAEAREQIEQTQKICQEEGDQYGLASSSDFLGGLAWAAGEYAAAIRNHAQAADLFHALGNPFNEAMALNNLGSAYWGTGEYAHAEETLQKALHISRELGHKRGEGDNLDNLGGIAWVLADYDTAVSYYNQALTIRRQINDQWGISISLGNLGSAYRLRENWAKALDHYAQALEINRGMGRRRGEGYNLHGRGLTYLDMGNLPAAQQDLSAALTIRDELGEVENQLETIAGLGIVAVACERLADAQTYLQEIEARQSEEHRPALRQWTHYAAYIIYHAHKNSSQARHHLRQAKEAMHTLADSLPAEDRLRYLQNFPLNRQIETAVAQYTEQIQMQLVHKNVPLGRKLTAADYITVTWTISALADDTFPTVAHRRQQIIHRLIQEAAQQKATPTDNDLATALNVSRRTILRDIKALKQTGILLPTRKR